MRQMLSHEVDMETVRRAELKRKRVWEEANRKLDLSEFDWGLSKIIVEHAYSIASASSTVPDDLDSELEIELEIENRKRTQTNLSMSEPSSKTEKNEVKTINKVAVGKRNDIHFTWHTSTHMNCRMVGAYFMMFI